MIFYFGLAGLGLLAYTMFSKKATPVTPITQVYQPKPVTSTTVQDTNNSVFNQITASVPALISIYDTIFNSKKTTDTGGHTLTTDEYYAYSAGGLA
ncbi:MAG: hypothetical protein V4501_12240 [Pseudomonadota bacterium]